MATRPDDRTRRLSAYTALAGGIIPVTAVSGAIVSQTGLDLSVVPGSPVALNFGPGFGEVFQFSVFQTGYMFSHSDSNPGSGYGLVRSYGWIERSSQVVQLLPAMKGGWTAASLLPYSEVANDPWRMSASYALGPNATGWVEMSNNLSALHDLAGQFRRSGTYQFSSTSGGSVISSTYGSFTDASIFGDFARSERGYIGLRFTNGVETHYAWIDVTADLDSEQMTIHGWAFNDTPGEGLHIPTPGAIGLGMLAMGAAGIRRHRRDAA